MGDKEEGRWEGMVCLSGGWGEEEGEEEEIEDK